MPLTSKIAQRFQKRSATGAAMNCHTTSWKTTKDRETNRLTVLFKNSIGEGPLGPVMQERHCERLVRKQLETIHPNPGPTRRGETERTPDRKAERNERRKKKRLEKREKKSPTTTTTRKRIVTWNVQGVTLRENNRKRLRRTIGFIRKREWEITLISEVRAEGPGVIWLGKDEETTAVIHSQKCGIILRVSALNEWVEGKKTMEFKLRATYIQIKD